jgi:hypothetical protein
MLDENEELRAVNKVQEAELALAKSQLKAIFEGNGMFGVLQQIALDPTVDPNLRERAANHGAPFERPKLAMTASVQPVKLFDILEARRNAGKVIEQAPGPKLDLAEGETILGGPDSAA